MAKVFIGATGYKMTLGNTKIKRGYLGNVLVYSGDIEVIYHIDIDPQEIIYTENVEEGNSCLSPKSFNPAGLKPGYTFLGWRSDDTPSPNVYTELIAGSDNIDLYAVYYKDYTINYYNASAIPTSKQYRSYYNNNNYLYPSTESGDLLMKDLIGYENSVGWTDIKDYYVQKYNNNSSIPEIKSDMNLYSIYSKNVTIYIVNGSNDGPIKSTLANTRYRQYNDEGSTTENPKVNIAHNNVYNWDNYGWNITLNSKDKTIDDGVLEISEIYDNNTVYALYSQPVSCRVVNGSNDGPVTTNINETRYRQYNTSYSDIHPVININHGSVSDFSSDGWNLIVGDYTSKYSDGNITLNSDFDDKSIMALYKKSVYVTVYNGNSSLTKSAGSRITLTRKRQYNTSSYTDLNPSTNLTHANVSGWSNYGWNITKNSLSRSFNDGTFTVTSAYDGKSIYALYTKNCTVFVYNGANVSPSYTPNKTTVTKTVIGQFNDSQMIRGGEAFNLSHAGLSGWASAGWSMSAPSTSVTFNDGNVEMKYEYDGKNIYALYNQTATIYLVNGTGGNITRTSVSGTRYREFYSVYQDFHPTTTLAHGTYSGYQSNGWKNEVTNNISDGNFTITSAYDGKTLYASYKKLITVTWFNTPGAANGTNMSSVATTSSSYLITTPVWTGSSGIWFTTNPTFTQTVVPYSNWTVLGWTTSNTWVSSATYSSGEVISTDKNLTLYGCYFKPVRLTTTVKGSVSWQEGTCYYNRGNGFTASIKSLDFRLPTVSGESGTDFIGWSTSSTSTNVTYPASQVIITITDNLALYNVWKYHNMTAINNPEGNDYWCGSGLFDRFVVENVYTVDLNKYDYFNIKCRTKIYPGEWASATWSWIRLFPGTTPVDYRNTNPKGDPNDQPESKMLRGVNWWASSGKIESDIGLTAYDTTVEITNNTLRGSKISVAFLGAMSNGYVKVFTLWLHGKNYVW